MSKCISTEPIRDCTNCPVKDNCPDEVEVKAVETPDETPKAEPIKVIKPKKQSKNKGNGFDYADYVPDDFTYIDHKDLLKNIAFADTEGQYCIFVGEPGTGKTSAVRKYAAENGYAFFRIPMNGSMTAGDIIGHWVFDEDNKMQWADGQLMQGLRLSDKGKVVMCLDELTMSIPEINAIFHACLDDDGIIRLDNPKEPIYRINHDNVVFVATFNGIDHAGNNDLNEALKDRAVLMEEVDYLPKAEEAALLVATRPETMKEGVAKEAADRIVKLAGYLRAAKRGNLVNPAFSYRRCTAFLKLANDRSLADALRLSVVNYYPEDDKEQVMDLVQVIFGDMLKSDRELTKETIDFIVKVNPEDAPNPWELDPTGKNLPSSVTGMLDDDTGQGLSLYTDENGNKAVRFQLDKFDANDNRIFKWMTVEQTYRYSMGLDRWKRVYDSDVNLIDIKVTPIT